MKFCVIKFRIIISRSCHSSTFKWVNFRSQTKDILRFFNYKRWNVVFLWPRLFWIITYWILVVPINWPLRRRFLFCGIQIVGIHMSRPWYICHYLRIDKLSFCYKQIKKNEISIGKKINSHLLLTALLIE